jgi:hypothetical protein
VKSELAYVTELDQDFEAKFWDFDNQLISVVQACHPSKDGIRKVVGMLFGLISITIAGKSY